MNQRSRFEKWMHLSPPALNAAEEVESDRRVVVVVEAGVQDPQARAGVEAKTLLRRDQKLEITVEAEKGAIFGKVHVEGRVELEALGERKSPVSADVEV